MRNSLNIAMFGHKRIPSREGGVEVVVEELSTRMVERGHSVTVYNRNGHHVSGGEFQKIDKYKGVNIKTLWTLDKKGLAALSSSVVGACKVLFGKYDIVHIHAEGPAAMSWLPHFFRKRVIVTVHGLDWCRAKWSWFASKYIKWGEQMAVKNADEIIVLSRSVQKYFKQVYGRDTVFIPNGVTKPEIRSVNEIERCWGLSKDSYVLFLGRIVPEKGLRYLIEAWKNVHTEKKLVIAGGSSDTQPFLNELKRNAPDDVIFTGFQQGVVLQELYSNAYIYVLPSDLEGMPLSLLEAMSYGNCCVVSDIPECVEVVEDKAVCFPKGNIDGLRKVLQKLLDSSDEVYKFKKNASSYICQKYNWNDIVNKTLDVYQR